MTGEEKFNSCKFRSSEKEPIDGAGISGCCGEKNVTEGYFCMKNGLPDINSGICEGCNYYKTKETLWQ